jgi:hypothetical protein
MAAANNQRTITLPPFGRTTRPGGLHTWSPASGQRASWRSGTGSTIVAALSKEIIQLRFNEVANPDDDKPYSHLKDTLVQHHTLTKYQRIEWLLAMGLLGSCRPTQLLAEIMELCPDDEEASCFFAFFFLHRLPSWLRVQLEGDDQDDIRRLATRVDCLFALHGHKHSGSVAEVENQEDLDKCAAINAVQGGVASAATAAAADNEANSDTGSAGPEVGPQGSQDGGQQL